jgi:hypothetical protein
LVSLISRKGSGRFDEICVSELEIDDVSWTSVGDGLMEDGKSLSRIDWDKGSENGWPV